MNYGFIRRRTYHIVLNCGRSLVRFVVHTKVVNLHPETHLLIAFESHGLSVGRRNSRADFGRANHKHSRTHVLGRYWLHEIGYDQRRSFQFVIREIWYLNAFAPGSDPVTVDVLNHDVHTVAPGPQ